MEQTNTDKNNNKTHTRKAKSMNKIMRMYVDFLNAHA
jgi:hypothetical protein